MSLSRCESYLKLLDDDEKGHRGMAPDFRTNCSPAGSNTCRVYATAERYATLCRAVDMRTRYMTVCMENTPFHLAECGARWCATAKRSACRSCMRWRSSARFSPERADRARHRQMDRNPASIRRRRS
ncbi:MAG: hypothetical protein ACLR8Y_07845 [Alistipes indistinctus]